jgi:hypothetical protein
MIYNRPDGVETPRLDALAPLARIAPREGEPPSDEKPAGPAFNAAGDPLTPFLSLTKPLVGDESGEDLWGAKLNANFDLIDDFASKQGALVEAPQDGLLYGRGTPYAWSEAVPKADYDTKQTAQDVATATNTSNIATNTSSIAANTTAIDGKAPLGPSDGNVYGWKGTTWFDITTSLTVDWGSITGKPTTFPPTLPIASSGVTGLDAKQTSQDSAIAAINWSSLSGKPATFPPTLPIAQSGVTNLVTDLAAKEPTITAGISGQYWDGTKTWKTLPSAVGLVDISDTPPSSPIDKQLWFESDTGNSFIRMNDGSSTQWVAFATKGIPDCPSDGGEYTRVNGVWRLMRKAYDLGGLITVDVPVPATAKHARLSAMFVTAAVSSQPSMLYSVDGTTFPNGASDYTIGGFTQNTGSAGFVNQVPVATTRIPLAASSDNGGLMTTIDAQFNVARPVGTSYTCTVRSFAYWNAATNVMQHRWYTMYPNVGAIASSSRLAALRIYSDVVWTAGANLTIEWMY